MNETFPEGITLTPLSIDADSHRVYVWGTPVGRIQRDPMDNGWEYVKEGDGRRNGWWGSRHDAVGALLSVADLPDRPALPTDGITLPVEVVRWAAESLVDDALTRCIEAAPTALALLDALRDAGIGNAAELCRDRVEALVPEGSWTS
jgi:hypothetical protein